MQIECVECIYLLLVCASKLEGTPEYAGLKYNYPVVLTKSWYPFGIQLSLTLEFVAARRRII